MFQLDGSFTYFLSTVMLVLVASIISFRHPRTDLVQTHLLAGYFWCYALATGITYLVVDTATMERMPHLFRTAQFPTLVVYPLGLMYVRRKLLGTGPYYSDLLLLLPIFLFTIDYLPFFMLSANEKLAIYHNLDSAGLKLRFAEGWFMPPYGHAALRYSSMLLCWVLELRILRKVALDVHHPYQYSHKEMWQWVRLFVYSQGLIFLVPLASLIAPASTLGTGVFNLIHLLISLIQCYYLLFHPKVLYAYPLNDRVSAEDAASASALPVNGPITKSAPTLPYRDEKANTAVTQNTSRELAEDASTSQPDEEETVATPAGFVISDEDLAEIDNKVNRFLTSAQAYTKPRYSIRNLSMDTGLGVHRISAMVNRRHGVNFYGYINRYRLALFEEKITQGDHRHKTLEALAQECGFQSRTTFIRAFKLAKGVTPSDYLNNLGQ